jgi:hypothetical protein
MPAGPFYCLLQRDSGLEGMLGRGQRWDRHSKGKGSGWGGERESGRWCPLHHRKLHFSPTIFVVGRVAQAKGWAPGRRTTRRGHFTHCIADHRASRNRAKRAAPFALARVTAKCSGTSGMRERTIRNLAGIKNRELMGRWGMARVAVKPSDDYAPHAS